MNAEATTIVGSTNGTVTMARNSVRPGNRTRATSHAPGSPTSSVSTVDATACQVVNHTSDQVRPSASTSAAVARLSSPTRPVATMETTGQAKKTARNAAGTP